MNKQLNPTQVLNDIIAHFPRTTGYVSQLGNSKPYVVIVTDHGKAERIGQYAIKVHSQVHTYFACHEFRKAHLSIYFK